MEPNFEENKAKVANEAGYIKLMKNETSRGVVSYSWDLKVVAEAEEEPLKKLIYLVEELNERMGKLFNNEDSN